MEVKTFLVAQFLFVIGLIVAAITIFFKIKKNWDIIEKNESEKEVEGYAMLALFCLALAILASVLLIVMTIMVINLF